MFLLFDAQDHKTFIERLEKKHSRCPFVIDIYYGFPDPKSSRKVSPDAVFAVSGYPLRKPFLILTNGEDLKPQRLILT